MSEFEIKTSEFYTTFESGSPQDLRCYGFLNFDREFQYHPHELFFLPITQITSRIEDYTTEGLVLQRTSLKESKYRRVGKFRHYNYGLRLFKNCSLFSLPFYPAPTSKDSTADIKPTDPATLGALGGSSEQIHLRPREQPSDTVERLQWDATGWVESVITII